MNKYLLFILFVLALNTAIAGSPGDEILWDTYGVPHIYAGSTAQMYFEFGWAQMHNHANLILKLYGQARGRGAEYWGEKYLASDKQVQMFMLPSLAAKEYTEQVPEYKKFLDSFIRGMNAYAAAHPEAISADNKQVLPVKAEDALAHGIRVIFLRFVASRELGMTSRKTQAGSNSYSIGPSRTASGNTLLLANPHLPWSDLFTFFEAHLQSPGFNAYGVAIVGLPVLNIAFNERLGWTHTVNPIDACDRYELIMQGDSYILDSALVPFQKKVVVLKVKGADGSLKEQEIEFRYSQHGPVVEQKENKAYAIRIAGMENPHIFYQWHLMAAATGWRQFEDALKKMQLPMFNVVYADAAGNIFYLFDGSVPRRPEGDWLFWNGTIDGRYSRYIWRQTLSYEELPKLFNPPTGFIQNANDPPWTCTYPGLLDPKKYPVYISSSGMSLRSQRAVNMIKNDSGITMEKLAGYKMNTGMEAADRFLPELLDAVKKYPDSLALKSAAVLSQWDKQTNANSRGAILFTRWFDLLTNDMYAKPWTPKDPVHTPAGLKDPGKAVDLLKQAALGLIRDYDSLNVAWGEIYRFRLGTLDYPATGGPEQYGIYRTIYFSKDTDNRYRAVAGDSYVAVTAFGKKTRAWVLLSYGNASQPGSKHAGDQLKLLSDKHLRDAWFEKKEVMENLEETERF